MSNHVFLEVHALKTGTPFVLIHKGVEYNGTVIGWTADYEKLINRELGTVETEENYSIPNFPGKNKEIVLNFDTTSATSTVKFDTQNVIDLIGDNSSCLIIKSNPSDFYYVKPTSVSLTPILDTVVGQNVDFRSNQSQRGWSLKISFVDVQIFRQDPTYKL